MRLDPFPKYFFCIASLFLLVGCGEKGTYELSWTIGCGDTESPDCIIRSAADCSSRGLDSVEVIVLPVSEETRAIFPCFSPIWGPKGEGPGLETGEYDLSIFGITPGGQRLVGPLSLKATIPEQGAIKLQIDFPVPPQCADGVDNDDDGLVDAMDHGCSQSQGTSE
jgi:hypothetical protein